MDKLFSPCIHERMAVSVGLHELPSSPHERDHMFLSDAFEFSRKCI